MSHARSIHVSPQGRADPSLSDNATSNKPRQRFQIVYPEQNGEIADSREIDIIAVHGLGSNVDWSWIFKDKEKHINWLRDPDMLPAKIPNARIAMYSYDSRWNQDAPKTRLQLCGEELLHSLYDLRDGCQRRPIVFVGHSLGGNVILEALLSARNDDKYDDFLAAVAGFVFLGTPFRGTKWQPFLQSLACIMTPAGSHDGITKELRFDGIALGDKLHQFCTLVNKLSIPVACFKELYKTDFGHRSRMIRLPKKIVVEESSACIAGYERYALEKNHLTLNKYCGPADPAFQRVSSVILRMCKESKDENRPPFERAVHWIPFSKNKYFVGRVAVLEDLKQKLFETNSSQNVALVGLGGMGKTQVALHLAHWVKDHKPDYSVFWLPAFSMAGFEQECLKLVKKLGIQLTEQEDTKEAIRQHLSSGNAGNWFLIIDNADDMEILRGTRHSAKGIFDFIPDSNNGRVLFTTRSKKVAVTTARNAVVELFQMGREEAIAFLQKGMINKDDLHDDATVTEFLKTLTFLPLAMSQAAAYMNTNDRTIAEYLELFRNSDKDMIELLEEEFRDHVHYDDSQGAVATTWIVSFEQIRRSSPSAADYLQFIALIDPKAIPRSILPSLETEQQMTQAIGTLLGYGFLSKREHDSMFDMHRLVHLATQIWIRERRSDEELRHMVYDRLVEVFPRAKWEDRDLWRQYLPHALRVVEVTGSAECDHLRRHLCELEFWAGRCLLVDRRVNEAAQILQHVVKVEAETLAEDDEKRLASQHALARAYLHKGQIKKAIELLEYLVAVKAKKSAEEDSGLCAIRLALARAYKKNGQVKKAIELLKHVITVEEKIFTEDNPYLLTSQHTLASTYIDNEQVKEAIDLLKHVVVAKEKIFTEDHRSLLTSQHELARAYGANKQNKEAIKLLEHVVAVKAKVYAEDHPSRLTSQHELAIAYGANEQNKEEIKLLEHVVAVQAKVYAEDHPNRLVAEHTLAEEYAANEQQDKEAIKLIEHVVAVQARVLAEDHPERLAAENLLADLLQTP